MRLVWCWPSYGTTAGCSSAATSSHVSWSARSWWENSGKDTGFTWLYHVGVSIHGGNPPNEWCSMERPAQLDHLGVPSFMETPMFYPGKNQGGPADFALKTSHPISDSSGWNIVTVAKEHGILILQPFLHWWLEKKELWQTEKNRSSSLVGGLNPSEKY